MTAPKLPCQTLPDWLRLNLGKSCLAPLTSTDRKALMAAVQIIDLFSVDRNQFVLDAFKATVYRMQESCWPLAYHAIAHVLDWSDRDSVWTLAKLPPINAGRCAHEPTRAA